MEEKTIYYRIKDELTAWFHALETKKDEPNLMIIVTENSIEAKKTGQENMLISEQVYAWKGDIEMDEIEKDEFVEEFKKAEENIKIIRSKFKGGI